MASALKTRKAAAQSTLERDEQAVWIPHDRIRPNPDQPRRHFDLESLDELRESLREHGLQQSIVVRYEPSRYDATPFLIVSGERRWRAAEGVLEKMRCTISNVEAAQVPELALVENLHREPLTPLEEARGIASLMESQGIKSQLAAARKLKKHPNWIRNRLELLKTGEDVQEVAARVPDKMLSLIDIDKVKDDDDERRELLEMTDSGASHEAIQQRLDAYRQRRAREAQAMRAPDSETQARHAEQNRSGGGQMSRGRVVQAQPRDETRTQIEAALSEMERQAVTLKAWADKAERGQLQRIEPRLARLRRLLREIG